MQHEIHAELELEQDETYLIWSLKQYFATDRVFDFRHPVSKWGYINELHIDVLGYSRSMRFFTTTYTSNLKYVFGLYLSRLTINLLTKEPEDVKSSDVLFRYYAPGTNCKTITFVKEEHLNNEEGRDKETTLENLLEVGPNLIIPYTLTIVEDRRGNQVKRTYSSPTRFRLELQ
jgi:hypothetical protein